jgi:hypothetical protein
MPFFIPLAATAAPFLIRMLVKYAWGPLIVGLGHLMKSRLGLFIASSFVWLGINFATLKLILGPTIDALRGFTDQVGNGGTSQFAVAAAGYIGIMQMDRAVTMIISAVVTKHAVLKGRLFLFKRGVGA